MIEGDKIQGLLVGIGTVVVTILMAQGEWDFFDSVISTIILLISVKFLKKFSFKSNIIISLFFGLILTTLSLSLISTMANVLSNCFLSTVSMETYKNACFSKNDEYTFYSISDYTIRNFIEEYDYIQETTLKKLEVIKDIDFLKLDLNIKLKSILKDESTGSNELYLLYLKNNSVVKELHYRNEIIWQIIIFLMMTILTYLILMCNNINRPALKKSSKAPA